MNSQIAEAIEATEAMKPSRCPKPQVQYPVATKYPSNILADSSGRCSTDDFEGVFGGDTNTPESTEKKEMTMAIIKCTECGKEISDKAATCPSCGAPVTGIQATAQEKTHSVRRGAITGFIGAIALPIIFIVLIAVDNATPKHEHEVSVSVSPAEGTAILLLPLLMGLAISLACFIIGITMANKLNRKQSITLSGVSVVASLTVLICLMATWSALLMCVGGVFGWEPILMTCGSIMMLNSSFKMPR